MSKCIKQITITETFLLDGSEGSRRYFKRNDQYCFESIVDLETDCETCTTDNKWRRMYYFVVVIDNETFYIPETQAVHDSSIIPEKFKSPYNYWADRNYQPADWKKVYNEIAGFRIETTECVQYNGLAMLKRIPKNLTDEVSYKEPTR